MTLPAPPIRCFALTLCALQIVFTITITITNVTFVLKWNHCCVYGQVEKKLQLLRQAIKRQTDILVQVQYGCQVSHSFALVACWYNEHD